MELGIDVSYYDPLIPWNKYTWTFAFIKASEGLYLDVDFAAQWKAAQGETVRGAYHFFRSFVDPINSANKFIGCMGSDIGELPPVIDLEDMNGMEYKEFNIRVKKWLNRVQSLTNKRPIIYTSPGFINTSKMYLYSEYSEYPLWLATYYKDEIDENWTETDRKNWIYNVLQARTLIFPPTPKPFKKINFLQWTAKCSPEFVPGYPLGGKRAVDVILYPGSTNDLFKEFSIIFVPKPKGDEMTDTTVTIEADLRALQPSNLRPAAGLQAGLIRTLVGPLHIKCVGQKVQLDGYYWSEVIEIGGVAEHGWIAWTTSYENITYPQQTTTKKVIKSTLTFDDGSTLDLFPMV